MRFANRVLFVTGGGSGLGAATARRYASEGGKVAIADRNEAAAKAVAASIPGALAIACDVGDEASVEAAVAKTHAHFGRLDSVFPAAGHVEFAPIEQFTTEAFERMLRVHVTGTFLVCRSALPRLRATGGGAIVTVASVAGLAARRNLAAYSAAKGAILGFSRQFALDAAEDKVRVNAIAPGTVRTGMTEPLYYARGEGDYAKGAALSSADSIQKRIAEPEEIAAPVCFLLSDEASFCTGMTMVADGGLTAI